ncbi:MAG TPA: tetratricopeptide repeat protein [Vicinamibacterales bacterium]|nr:tetratricopeptide repeat protein [Vicinamibacterales bacterium]
MAADTPRILELRRRVQSDPASIAFAQLAEELRRAGAYEEAVDVCRAGLARHPAYLSARVTLGRALVELEHLDDAQAELTIVVSSASDNLAAIRGLAEIHQRRGEMGEALGYYRRALELARHDPELEETVERMEKQVVSPAPPEAPFSVEALFDFDRLVEQLGADAGPDAPSSGAVATGSRSTLYSTALPGEAPVATEPESDDAFSRLEAGLRQHQPRPLAPSAEEAAPAEAEAAALGALEDWLEALRSSPR